MKFSKSKTSDIITEWKKMNEIKIGDTLVVIVTGNTENPLCTKIIVKDILPNFHYNRDTNTFDRQGIVIIDLVDGLHKMVGVRISEITKDSEGNWCYVKEIE